MELINNMSRLAVCGLLALAFAGCAGSRLDVDFREKVSGVTPISISAGGNPPTLRLDCFRMDIRQPAASCTLPAIAGLKK